MNYIPLIYTLVILLNISRYMFYAILSNTYSWRKFMEFIFNVNMTCQHCVEVIKETLETTNKIINLDINLEKKTVKGLIPNNNISINEIKEIIKDIGFNVT